MKKVIVFTFVLMSSISVLQAKTLQKPLGVKLQLAVSYQCADKTKLNVRYYTLSDKSLSFVKIKLNGKIYALPQAVAASGVKYSDGLKLTWWTKGNQGTIYEQNEGPEESWPATHEDCRENETK